MDELLAEFLTETGERLDELDVSLVRFEQDPNDAAMLDAIFRLVHTIKGTCGFLDLHRLAKLAHAAETLMGQYRDGAPVTVEGVSVILAGLDRIKDILANLEHDGAEPPGSDDDLIEALHDLAEGSALAQIGSELPIQSVPSMDCVGVAPPVHTTAEELERAWQEAPGPDTTPEPETQPSLPSEKSTAEEDRIPQTRNRSGEPGSRAQTVRVSVETLEHLMTTVSELVLTRNQLLDLVRRTGETEFKSPLQRLSSVTVELQEGIMKARMQPIANAWQKLPRLVRELSIELGKQIELDMSGGDTELDRQVLELIKDPLTHMIRNSADHGLETPRERAINGKPPTGRIKLGASQQGGYIMIEVTDDGRGLDVQRVRAKALENGLTTSAELDRMSDSEIFSFIFKPGFSTATAVSELSGRGVGMDVVRSNMELIGGTVELESTSPEGTTFVIKIPLTLAIMAALIVEVAGTRFAIPQLSVIELVRTGEETGHLVESINDTALLRLRDKLLPLLDFAPLLGLRDQTCLSRISEGGMTAVVVQVGTNRVGLLVDKVFRTEEIVVKPLSSVLRHVGMYSGNTILGDGSVIMIVDPNGLAAAIGSLDMPADVADNTSEQTLDANQNRTSLLLFRSGGDKTLKAVPLSLITRLEEIATNTVERCNGHDVVQYRGSLMPLIRMEGGCAGTENDIQPVLVFTEDTHPAGLVIDEIVDIVEESLVVELQADAPGVIGAAIVRGSTVEIVDVSHYLGSVFDAHRASAPIESERALRVLLVDDSQFFRNMLAPLLRASGYEVALAASAQEALAFKDEGKLFDLIVSDIDMPGMDGLDLAKHLKADSSWAEIPLIALSSHANPRLLEKSREAGFESFVGKFDRQTLMRALQDCVKGWGAAA